MFIVSLPPVHQIDLLTSIIENPIVDAVRYNTGVASARDSYGTLKLIKELAEPFNKPIYVDLKAKQLRIVQWSDIPYGPIILNHHIHVELPAKVYFRGDDVCNLCEVVNGKEIYVDPLPRFPVGNGQSVNILAQKLTIEEGLLEKDHQYIQSALELGITKFMLSFTENVDDICELESAIIKYSRGTIPIEQCEIVLKIESVAGVEFVKKKLTRKHFSIESPYSYRLMVARDDLMIHIGVLNMPDALQAIAKKDPHAICASRLLMGLASEEKEVSMADLSDLKYMQSLGYEHFMLSDGISHRHSKEAIRFWESYSKLKL